MTSNLTLTPENAGEIAKNLARRKYGGMTIKPASTLDAGLVMAIFGKGGSGKTTLAATATDTEYGRPGLLVNCFGNPHVVSSYEDRLDVGELTSFNQANTACTEMLADPNCRYKTLIFDHITAMLMKRQHELYGPATDVKWEMHSASTADVLQLILNALLLSTSRHKMNVIFLFQEATEERAVNGVKVLRQEIAANKAIQEQFPGLVPFVGKLYIDGETAPFNRMLDFTPAEKQHVAKIQRDPKHELAKTIPMQIYKPSLAPIIETMRGVKPFPVDQHKKKLGD